jgi:hypothetical protein
MPHKMVAVRNKDRMAVDKCAAVGHRVTVGPIVWIRITVSIGVVGVRVSRIGYWQPDSNSDCYASLRFRGEGKRESAHNSSDQENLFHINSDAETGKLFNLFPAPMWIAGDK